MSTSNGWELDCYWPEHKLAVELDGRNYHTAVKDMERDRYKDTQLLLLGIRPVRITELRFELEPGRILADLRNADYLSSAEVLPSSWRATISSWICWVPSNRSRILASRAHFSSSSPSA